MPRFLGYNVADSQAAILSREAQEGPGYSDQDVRLLESLGVLQKRRGILAPSRLIQPQPGPEEFRQFFRWILKGAKQPYPPLVRRILENKRTQLVESLDSMRTADVLRGTEDRLIREIDMILENDKQTKDVTLVGDRIIPQQAPELQTPEPQAPEPQTPELQTPELQTPELQTPEPQAPELQTPEPQTPEPQTPEPQTPEPQTPEPQTPELQTPHTAYEQKIKTMTCKKECRDKHTNCVASCDPQSDECLSKCYSEQYMCSERCNPGAQEPIIVPTKIPTNSEISDAIANLREENKKVKDAQIKLLGIKKAEKLLNHLIEIDKITDRIIAQLKNEKKNIYKPYVWNLYLRHLDNINAAVKTTNKFQVTIKGIPNFGNTCFANAAIQMMYGIPEYYNYVMKGSEPTNIQTIFKYLDGSTGIDNRKLEDAMLSFYKCIGVGGQKHTQEDPDEFLVKCLLTEKTSIYKYLAFNNNSYNWLGDERPQEPNKQEETLILNLPLTGTGKISDLINEYTKIETVERTERNIAENREIQKVNSEFTVHTTQNKQIEIEIPDENKYLIINLKRAVLNKNGEQRKLVTAIKPDEELTIDNHKYKLKSFLIHSGESTGSGHYIFYAKQSNDDWVEINDDYVTENITLEKVVDKKMGKDLTFEESRLNKGYMYLYERVDVEHEERVKVTTGGQRRRRQRTQKGQRIQRHRKTYRRSRR
jgi:ubiquitin C-terminal hydrolase